MTEDFEGFRWNTMVAKLMELSNTLFRYRGTSVAGLPEWDEAVGLLLLMLAPSAPHITEELWSRRLEGRGRAVGVDPRPRGRRSTSARSSEQTREVPIQVNGKLRDRITVPVGISEIELEQIVMARDKVIAAIGDGAGRAGHLRGRRQARQHRPARVGPVRPFACRPRRSSSRAGARPPASRPGSRRDHRSRAR